jgi:hypothetical protein
VKSAIPLEIKQAEMKLRWAAIRKKTRSLASNKEPVVRKSRRKTPQRMANEFIDVYLKQISVEESINDSSSG